MQDRHCCLLPFLTPSEEVLRTLLCCICQHLTSAWRAWVSEPRRTPGGGVDVDVEHLRHAVLNGRRQRLRNDACLRPLDDVPRNHPRRLVHTLLCWRVGAVASNLSITFRLRWMALRSLVYITLNHPLSPNPSPKTNLPVLGSERWRAQQRGTAPCGCCATSSGRRGSTGAPGSP